MKVGQSVLDGWLVGRVILVKDGITHVQFITSTVSYNQDAVEAFLEVL